MGLMTMKSTRRVLYYSLLRFIIHSHHSFIRLHHTACFGRALPFAHLLARCAHLLTLELKEKKFLSLNQTCRSYTVLAHCAAIFAASFPYISLAKAAKSSSIMKLHANRKTKREKRNRKRLDRTKSARARFTMGRDRMKSTRSCHRQKSLFHELRSE